ncbi:WS/DGAT/MGAT family O-acyltransferase [Salinisphaera hydrothermalis]|uniref:diacylglycerol O-acyltransferase n=1 Tax=Salinisphaera hydrothermalis (strain C41B8) TaxID=1304275 RepID=A0A084IPX7_SALHC|nr:wax ester/triacylglycerol synthase family O-acyltransferase [Salinisphaera hydrothermalis]KEZ78761.1 acyltransferase, WS/DGAT/MGAT [Salinisphaera hydrothermalis C41B8]
MSIVDPISQIFLRLERRNQPMHIGGLQLFSVPENAPADYVHQLVDRARAQNAVQPPFDKRLKYRFGQPFWIEDQDFDMEYHVRHLALPEPGAIRDLLALVSMLHGALLDRARPLWEVYFIEGVTDNRFAVYTKFHHSMMDGISAMRVLRRFLSIDPGTEHFRVPWQLPPRPSSRSHAWSAGLTMLQSSYRQAAALPAAARSLYDAWHDAHHDPDFTGPAQAPACILNRPVSGSRRFAAQGYSMTRIRDAADAYGTTVNDVVLAMCASALRRYLIDLDALPRAPLIAMLPVSLHDDDDAAGNRIALIYANLATDIDDPVERLGAIKRSVDYWKRRYKRMSSEQIMAVVAAMSAPAGLNLLSGLVPSRQSFNVVISNVPGPDDTLYFGDAEMLGMYPMSIVLDGQALNISLVSYRDTLEFGLIACRRSLPSMQNLLKYLDDALDELEHAAGHVPHD